MYQYQKIANFLCFDSLELPKPGRANLITVKNGSGKSALMEAIFLFCR